MALVVPIGSIERDGKWLLRLGKMIRAMLDKKIIVDVAVASHDPRVLRRMREIIGRMQTIRTYPYTPHFAPDHHLFRITANREALRRWFCDETSYQIMLSIDADVYCPDVNIILEDYILPVRRREVELIYSTHVGHIMAVDRKTICSVTWATGLYYPSKVPVQGLEELVRKPEIFIEENFFVYKQLELMNWWCRHYINKDCVRIRRIEQKNCYHRDCPRGQYKC